VPDALHLQNAPKSQLRKQQTSHLKSLSQSGLPTISQGLTPKNLKNSQNKKPDSFLADKGISAANNLGGTKQKPPKALVSNFA
jgi:hypothetical protein